MPRKPAHPRAGPSPSATDRQSDAAMRHGQLAWRAFVILAPGASMGASSSSAVSLVRNSRLPVRSSSCRVCRAGGVTQSIYVAAALGDSSGPTCSRYD